MLSNFYLSGMCAAVLLDQEENIFHPTFNVCRVVVLNHGAVAILHCDVICLKREITDHLGNVGVELNAQLCNGFPLRIGQEPVKSPGVDFTVEIVNVKPLANFVVFVINHASRGIDLVKDFFVVLLEFLKRGEIAGSSHFSNDDKRIEVEIEP